jgi:tagatose-6-phosphate ketose/aldose isomerase
MVATGPLAAVATESALKVLEMSAGRVKTLSETTLGLRHGPMASLDPETLFICFISTEAHRQRYGADLLGEIAGKGITAARIGVGPASARDLIEPLCETYLELELEVADSYRAIVDVLFGQMLGLCISVEHGLRPDAPSPGGVISRVVQDFHIYAS